MSIIKKHGAKLPHWHLENGIYFITFRLEGSLPSFLAKDRKEKRAEILIDAEKKNRRITTLELEELEDLHFRDLDLQRHDHRACFMKDERIAKIVADALLHFHKKRYHLYAWCVMLDHVHVVVQPIDNWSLSKILHSWKRFSAREANKLLQRRGAFWQEESYDHLIRNETDLQRCIEYTWNNPEKAGLRNWQWKGKDMENYPELEEK